ncbi:MAG: hypothetical protein OFPII_34610 [Osedax symbiont Rs1]|nr:MAG: hypothetical protein OFPII_34610 [Osedax symbiont Rs1]
MFLTVFTVSCCGVILSWILETLCLVPKSTVVWRRQRAVNLVHISNWLLCFTLVLAITQRPWFSLAIICCAQLFMLLVNQAKYHSLREPFLAQDFEYFSDAIKHPRLYIPFFGVWRIVLAVTAISIAIATGLTFEASLLDSLSTVSFALHIALLLLGSSAVLFLAVKQLPVASLNPERDQHKFGQMAFLYSYFAMLFKPVVIDAALGVKKSAVDKKLADSLPHIVAVQSESFFDPRLCYPMVNPAVLSNFDQICTQALQFGSIKVPAWGANTVRTEAAFLTGLTPEQLGIHQFNPYRLFAKQPVLSLAKVLQQAGYKTLCIHPYPVSFYLRDQVFPALGFDQFIDITSFSATDKQGQYTSDQAVAKKVDDILQQATQPLFIFVISMENHGPLHLEKTNNAELDKIFSAQGVSKYNASAAELADLNTYLRHLRNADTMVAQLTTSLKQQSRAGLLAWYGDHIPIMPKVYAALGEPSPDTPYFIWHSQQSPANSQQQEQAVHNLAGKILHYIGLPD